jgi:hypothetical protein
MEAVHRLAIILLCFVAAITYGVLHDQVTARLCVEYFTIGHPRLFESESPGVLGLAWGVIATWPVGLILGLGLSLAARSGRRPQQGAAGLVRPVAILLAAMGCAAFLAGVAGLTLARLGFVFLVEPLASAVPQEKHVWFLADLWAHWASYLSGFAGGIGLCVVVWRRRGRLSRSLAQARVAAEEKAA